MSELPARCACASFRGVVRLVRLFVLPPLIGALLLGCGNSAPARRGDVAFRSGSPAGESGTRVVEGPALRRPGVLVPVYAPTWQSAWLDKTAAHPVIQGATAGMLTGLAIVQVAPVALMFWPAAAGILVGATAMGMVGGAQPEPPNPLMPLSDRRVIAEATAALRPDQLFRDAMARALAERTGAPLPVVDWLQTWGPDTVGTDPLAEARARGLDGVFEFTLEGIGLAVDDEPEMFGVFAQVRVRALDARDGAVRYERVLSYGPGQPVDGFPKPDTHTVEMLAINDGLVYRHIAGETLRRLARLLAEDPALPLAR